METSEPLADLRRSALDRLRRATVDRRSAFRTPVVCTADEDGAHGRTMVLRDVRADPGASSPPELVFFTDARTPKSEQLTRPCEVVFWDPRSRVQLRARGDASLVAEGAEWRANESAQRDGPGQLRDYRTVLAPGTPIADPDSVARGDESHFAMVVVRVRTLEWLELGRGGHRRARFDFTPEPHARWHVP